MEKSKKKIGGLFLNGQFEEIEITQKFHMTVACDGGYENALKAGITPDILLGDMDSISNVPQNVKLEKFPSEKDFTDGEAGLEHLVKNGCNEIYIYFGLGKRLSHTISNIQMATKYLNTADITFFGMQEKVMLKNKSFKLREKIGKTISLAPISEKVHIITSKGLKYPLENLTLTNQSARGVSNMATENEQVVKLESGTLLIAVWEE